ncbi:MAG: hypothetical protein Q8M15_07410 [Bacteroidota bacterium]|nr:hypothetical protein [Bacteroidota bacterium]
MKTRLKINILLSLLIMSVGQVIAQDKMILRYKADTLYVKVFEIGTSEVKYKLWPVDENMPIMAESRDKIKTIIFANGTKMKFTADEFSDATNYAEQRKTAVKLDPFSILAGMTSIAYEQSMKPGRSWEVGLGLIGLGTTFGDEKYSGLLVRAGYKFINQPDYYMRGMRYTHILKGGYIRPEIAISFYNTTITGSYNNYNTNTTFQHQDKYRTTALAFLLNFGKQWVFDDIFVVDAFLGLGIGGGKQTAVDVGKDIGTSPYGYYGYYDYSYDLGVTQFGFFTSTSGSITFAGQGGLKVGILLGKKKTEKN